jgi:hypothetical protein
MYKVIKNGLNTSYVDEKGSRAIVNGFFFIDGRKAPEGTYTLETENENITINTDATGKVISNE